MITQRAKFRKFGFISIPAKSFRPEGRHRLKQHPLRIGRLFNVGLVCALAK